MTDPYFPSPGGNENPRRVALIRRVTWAYLRHGLDIEDSGWAVVQKTLSESAEPLGRIESR